MIKSLLNIYFRLPSDSSFGILSKMVNRTAAKFVKKILDEFVVNYYEKTQSKVSNGLNAEQRYEEVIVSLTTFPARIQEVWIVVECLFRQTFKPDKIVLWLDKNRFDITTLPIQLKKQISRGLEIRFVEDLRSHTKYFYALSEFKNKIVVTVDDDCYYPNNLLENLINIHKEFPSSIVSNRVHKLTFNSDKLNPYSKWQHNYSPKHSISGKYLLTGVGGVLYPPNIFDEKLFNKAVFLEKCKYADDIWLAINAFILDLDVASNNTFNKDFISISNTSEVRLLDFNSKGNGNDFQIKNLLDHYNLGELENYRNE